MLSDAEIIIALELQLSSYKKLLPVLDGYNVGESYLMCFKYKL